MKGRERDREGEERVRGSLSKRERRERLLSSPVPPIC